MLPMQFKEDLLHHRTCPARVAINKDESASLEFCTGQPVLCRDTLALGGTHKRVPQVCNMSNIWRITVTYLQSTAFLHNTLFTLSSVIGKLSI